MTKIEKLTDEQIALFPSYVKEWTQKGLTTQQRTQEEAEVAFEAFQRHSLKMENPAPVVLLDSPKKCWAKVCEVTGLKEKDFVYPYFDCQYWAGWFSFYEFMRKEVGVKYDCSDAYSAFIACQGFSMVWPLKEICVVCQPPTILRTNERGLHCEDGPALSYNGDNECYSLNGIKVSKELVMTPAEDLSMAMFTREKNADVKAEFVRKYGIERMVDIGKIVDSYENYDQEEQPWWWKSEYTLIDMHKVFTDIPYQPYLKMLNQTTGIWHMEACSPNVLTLTDAVKERFGGREMKIVSIS